MWRFNSRPNSGAESRISGFISELAGRFANAVEKKKNVWANRLKRDNSLGGEQKNWRPAVSIAGKVRHDEIHNGLEDTDSKKSRD